MTEPIGRAAVEAVISSAVRFGLSAVKLKYAGGEASLNHRLVIKLHAYASELTDRHGLRLHATLLSNGVRLPPSLVSFCKAEGIGVMISLDGMGEQHDAQRPFPTGKPSFKLVERTIADLINTGHPPHLSVTITSRNAPGVADVVRYALDRDLTFSLNLFRDNDCAASFTDLQYEEQAMIASLLAAFGVIEDQPAALERARIGSRSRPVAAAQAAIMRSGPGLRGHRPARPGRQVPYGAGADPGRCLRERPAAARPRRPHDHARTWP